VNELSSISSRGWKKRGEKTQSCRMNLLRRSVILSRGGKRRKGNSPTASPQKEKGSLTILSSNPWTEKEESHDGLDQKRKKKGERPCLLPGTRVVKERRRKKVRR